MTLVCSVLLDAEFTAVEQLLAQYMEAGAQYEQRMHMARVLRHRVHSEQNSRRLVESRRSSFDTESEDISATVTTTVQPPETPPSIVSASVQATPESGKKPRKRRFFFENWHDVLLLNVVLADRGVVLASGVRKPAWKSIEASVNSQGLPVNTHTIRTHLRLLVDAYRREKNMWYMDPDNMSEKQKLLREYSKKLDDEEQQTRDSSDDQSFELTDETQDERFGSSEENRAGVNRSQTSVNSLGSVGPSGSHVPSVGVVTTTNVAQTQDDLSTTTRTSDTASATQIPSTTRARDAIVTTTQTSDPVRPPPISRFIATMAHASSDSPSSPSTSRPPQVAHTPLTSRVFSVAQTSSDTEAREVTEPASKKQKLETMLGCFISEQNERQREHREHERTRFSEQQDLQRQTIDLQKGALDIQEKAMNMQERLMALMEKVMDKLS